MKHINNKNKTVLIILVIVAVIIITTTLPITIIIDDTIPAINPYSLYLALRLINSLLK